MERSAGNGESPPQQADFARALRAVLDTRATVPARRAALVAISGIDGSGKGFVSQRLMRALELRGVRTALLGVDDWLNLPRVRFDAARPAETFYERALRLDDMLEQLVLPLRDGRSHSGTNLRAAETATDFVVQPFRYEDVDVILVEGIFLLKRALRPTWDCALWIDCSFETALERALARGQEGLPPDATIRAYHTIYFPAQRIHFVRDEPRAAADLIIVNDDRLRGAPAGPVPPAGADSAPASDPGPVLSGPSSPSRHGSSLPAGAPRSTRTACA
jgi:uridine kinase